MRLARRYAVLAGLLVTGGAVFGWFHLRSRNLVYSFTVDELFAKQRARPGSLLRVEGTVAPGSIVRREEPCQYRFKLIGTSRELPVVYDQCVVPENFCDRADRRPKTIVEGVLDEVGTFRASHLFVFCGGKAEFRTLPDGGRVFVPNEACRCGKSAAGGSGE